VGGLLGVFAKSILDKGQLKFSKVFEFKERRYQAIAILMLTAANPSPYELAQLRSRRPDLKRTEDLDSELRMEYHNAMLYASPKVLKNFASFLKDESISSCIGSVEEIRTRLVGFIAASQSEDLRNSLRGVQAACRQFLTDAHAIEDKGIHIIDVQRGGSASWLFNQALGELRARIGTSVAIIIEAFDVDIDEHLAKIMPPPIDEEHA
jgi:hypothetical protein